MPVVISLSTTLRQHVPGYRPDQGLALAWDGHGSALELARKIGLPIEDVKITMLNGRRVELNTPVKDGDRVAFFPAVGGG